LLQKLPGLFLYFHRSRSFARLIKPYFVTMQRDLVKTADCSEGRVPITSEMFSTAAKLLKFSEYGIRKHSHLQKASPDHKSRTLTSPIVTIRVGKEKPVAFNLHRVLVCNESARFAKTFQGAFKEASEQECTLPEEDPRLFGYFVEYMYREGWLHENNKNTNHVHCSKILTLARLYTMGDRFLAKAFQDLTLLKLGSALSSGPDLSDQDICELLEIAGAELPDLPEENPLQAQIFWYAAGRISRLQKFDRFPELLREHPQLGVKLCMRAGSGSTSQPKLPQTYDDSRFKPETLYSA
jgi:BTB/POZ domain